jgi:hypothetical protein
MIRANLPLIAFAVLVLAAGTILGLHSGRWGSSANLDEAVGRLNTVPANLGDWRGEEAPFDADDLRRNGIRGHASYRYRNMISGERVSMLIVCGRFGPISVHTPDVCYDKAGYQRVGEEKQKTITLGHGRTVSVRALRFNAPTTSAFHSSQIEVCWSWNGGKGWVAPENSRWTFAGYPVLYKLYVVRDISGSAKDPSVSFLQTFLPELEKIFSR